MTDVDVDEIDLMISKYKFDSPNLLKFKVNEKINWGLWK